MSLRLIPWHYDPNEDASDDEDFPQRWNPCRVMMSVSVGSPVKADHPLSKQDTTSLPFATIPSEQTHEHTQKETHTQMYANSQSHKPKITEKRLSSQRRTCIHKHV